MHLEEVHSTLLKPRVAELIKPYRAGRLVNQIKRLAQDIDQLTHVERSPDPKDDFLLALSEAGSAGYLVTGDKSGLPALGRHKDTQIVSATDFLALLASTWLAASPQRARIVKPFVLRSFVGLRQQWACCHAKSPLT